MARKYSLTVMIRESKEAGIRTRLYSFYPERNKNEFLTMYIIIKPPWYGNSCKPCKAVIFSRVRFIKSRLFSEAAFLHFEFQNIYPEENDSGFGN